MSLVKTENLFVLATSESHLEDLYMNQEVGYQAWYDKVTLAFWYKSQNLNL